MNRRSSTCLLIVWCLLSLWLFYGGLELAEELKLAVKVQPCAQDLDMECLLQLASGLKPDVPTLVNQPLLSETAEAVKPSLLTPTHTIDRETRYAVQVSSSLRLHQYLSIYRI